jgi:hypothetical protein
LGGNVVRAQITEGSIVQIDKTAKFRNNETAANGKKAAKESPQRGEEPSYDPTNPWNK